MTYLVNFLEYSYVHVVARPEMSLVLTFMYNSWSATRYNSVQFNRFVTYQSFCFNYSYLKWLIFQMDFECFIGTLNVFLSPRQVHLLTKLASGFSSPGLLWGNVTWGLFLFAGFTICKEDKGPPIVKAELEKRCLVDTHFILWLYFI